MFLFLSSAVAIIWLSWLVQKKKRKSIRRLTIDKNFYVKKNFTGRLNRMWRASFWLFYNLITKCETVIEYWVVSKGCGYLKYHKSMKNLQQVSSTIPYKINCFISLPVPPSHKISWDSKIDKKHIQNFDFGSVSCGSSF